MVVLLLVAGGCGCGCGCVLWLCVVMRLRVVMCVHMIFGGTTPMTRAPLLAATVAALPKSACN